MNKKIIPTTRYGGFVDLVGEDVIKEKKMVDAVTSVFENFGYIPLETPPIESMKVLGGKGGEEAQRLMYKGELDSSGVHDWAVRFDLTVPFASFVATNSSQLPDPFKRWQYGFVARGERAQVAKGRLRGFKQLDLDCVSSVLNPMDDVDVIAGMLEVMKAFSKIKSTVMINDRRILDALVLKCGLTKDSAEAGKLLLIVDKFDKIGKDGVLLDVKNSLGEKTLEIVEKYLDISGNYLEITDKMRELVGEYEEARLGIDNLIFIGNTLSVAGYEQGSGTWQIAPQIARGLNYYTSTVYETIVSGYEDRGSVFSGGRYDELVEKLGGPKIKAVGSSVGVSRLLTILDEVGFFENIVSGAQVMILAFPEQKPGNLLAIAKDIRTKNVACEIVANREKNMGKQIQEANKRGCKFVVMQGTDEEKKRTILVKNLDSFEQVEIARGEVGEYILQKFTK